MCHFVVAWYSGNFILPVCNCLYGNVNSAHCHCAVGGLTVRYWHHMFRYKMPTGRATVTGWNVESRYSPGVLIGNWQEARMDVSYSTFDEFVGSWSKIYNRAWRGLWEQIDRDNWLRGVHRNVPMFVTFALRLHVKNLCCVECCTEREEIFQTYDCMQSEFYPEIQCWSWLSNSSYCWFESHCFASKHYFWTWSQEVQEWRFDNMVFMIWLLSDFSVSQLTRALQLVICISLFMTVDFYHALLCNLVQVRCILNCQNRHDVIFVILW